MLHVTIIRIGTIQSQAFSTRVLDHRTQYGGDYMITLNNPYRLSTKFYFFNLPILTGPNLATDSSHSIRPELP